MENLERIKIREHPTTTDSLSRKLKSGEITGNLTEFSLEDFKYYEESNASLIESEDTYQLDCTDDQISDPMSPLSVLSPNTMFDRTWKEIESACEFETLPNLSFGVDLPLFEGELLVLENRRNLFKRWWVLKDDTFTIYQSFRDRHSLIDIKINDKTKVISAYGREILHGFRVFSGIKSVECYAASLITAQTWMDYLSRTLSPLTTTNISQYTSNLSPDSPLLEPKSVHIMQSAPAKMSSPKVKVNGLSIAIPARNQSLHIPKKSIRTFSF